MAISGSTDFDVTRTQIIDSALRVLGVLRAGDTVENDANMETDCAQALNMMLKAWQNLGMQLWTKKQEVIAWESGTRTKSIKSPGGDVNIAQPLRIIDAQRRSSSNIDTSMILMTRQEYDNQSSKFSNGTPVQYYYDPQLTQGNLYVWPVPSSNTNIVIVYQDQYDDMDSNTDTLEFPNRWLEAAKWNLAIRLAPEYGRQLDPVVAQMAVVSLESAQMEGYEEGSIRFRPSPRARYGR